MIEPLAPEIEALLSEERALPPVSPGLEARLWARLVKTLALGSGGLLGSGTIPMLALFIGAALLGGVALRAHRRPASSPASRVERIEARRTATQAAPAARATSASIDVPAAAAPAPGWFGQRGLEPRAVRGRVMSRGAPAAGARVSLASFPNALGVAAPETIADASGAFELPSRPPWMYVVTARLPGLVASEPVDLRDPDSIPVELILRPCHTIRGRVVTDGGEPVAGATVTSIVMIYFGPETETESGGTFELCTVGDLPLRIDATGFGSVVVEPHDGIEVAVGPGATVSGTAVTPAGEPVPGVQLNLWSRDLGPQRAAHRLTLSDASGRFRFDDVGVGHFWVNGWAADSMMEAGIYLTTAPGQQIDLVAILEPMASVQGAVLRDGQPVVGAYVRAAIPGRGLSFSAITQRDGSFTIHGVALGDNTFEVEGFEVLSPAAIRVERGGLTGVRVEVR